MRRAAGGGRAHIAQWPLASQFDFRIPHFAFRISHSAFRAACERGGGLESQNRPCSRRFRTPFCLADACRSRTVAATSDLPRVAAGHTLRSGSRPYVGVKGAAECGLRSAECGMRSAECCRWGHGGLESQNRPCSRRFRTSLCLADASRIRTVAATCDAPRVAALHTWRSGLSRPSSTSAFRISHFAFRTPHSELPVSVVVALRARIGRVRAASERRSALRTRAEVEL